MRFVKEYVIIVVILIFVLVIDYFTGKNLTDFVDWMSAEIRQVEEKLSDNNETAAQEQFYKMKEQWEKESEKLALYVEHNELEKIGNDVVIIESNFSKNEGDEISENIADLKFMLQHIEEKNKLKLKNIF